MLCENCGDSFVSTAERFCLQCCNEERFHKDLVKISKTVFKTVIFASILVIAVSSFFEKIDSSLKGVTKQFRVIVKSGV
jgi:hypothetical protein